LEKQRLNFGEVDAIRKNAIKLLRNIDCFSAPVPVEKVVKSLGATLRYGPYSDGSLAGMLVRGENPVIAVNSAHHKNRQRFTIAHECGHLVLHNENFHIDEDFPILRRDENSSLALDKREVEANQFAAEILMPLDFLKNDLSEKSIDIEDDLGVRSLSKKYMVSMQAMTYRLINAFQL